MRRHIIRITEEQAIGIINEGFENFSYSTLKNTDWKNHDELEAYCQRCGLSMLGNGFDRNVYALDDRLVIKVIRSNDTRQNSTEINVYQSVEEDLREMLPMILSYDNRGNGPMWIISERVLPASYADFQKILGFDFGSYVSTQDIKDMENDLETYKDYPGKNKDEGHLNLMEFLESFDEDIGDNGFSYLYNVRRNPWLAKLYRMIRGGHVGWWELENIDNWGLVNRNGKPFIVILDVGI